MPTRIVFGEGSLERVPELLREHSVTSVFLVTDPGIVAAGHVEILESMLTEQKVAFRRFDQVDENPTEANVQSCTETLGDWPADVIIAIGGGSSIDVAKGCAFVHAGGGRMRDYHGQGKARGQLLPVFAIPTTAGTGSEVQSYALISKDDTHQKMACGDAQAAPLIAILDPQLTVTLPHNITACTGLDTLAHAVETAVTNARTSFSTIFSQQAFGLVNRHLPRVLKAPRDLVARAGMLRASAFAGIAIENSMLGAAHSMANPLTAQFGIAHGQAVGQLLPFVVKYNAEDADAASIYAGLAYNTAIALRSDDEKTAVNKLIARLRSLVEIAGFPPIPQGVSPSAVDALAQEATEQWTAQFNPRPLDAAAFRSLFAQVAS